MELNWLFGSVQVDDRNRGTILVQKSFLLIKQAFDFIFVEVKVWIIS